MKELFIGICEPGIRHASADTPATIRDRFAMVKDEGVFDYIDVTPWPSEVAEYARCSESFDIPILAGSRNYILGKQEHELEENIRIGAALGSIVHNTQVFMDHADGHLVNNDEVMEAYLKAYELGDKLGCLPCFEVHVNMWSEQFTRIAEVAKAVSARGVPFHMTLDHSHVIFKIDNPVELAVFGVDTLIKNGALVIDPMQEGNVFQEWLAIGIVRHCHARSVAPNNPKNVWAHHPDINNLRSSLHPRSAVGRGIQYPFVKPEEGQWHSPWQESDLSQWKRVIEMVMRHHITSPSSELKTISTEFIPFTDYGEGAGYSLLENNAACARWLKSAWQTLNR